jgi:hypothetical protein
MDSMDTQDISFIDIDELGVRPLNSMDDSNDIDFDDTTHGYFGKEKLTKLQSINNDTKLRIDDEDTSIFDEDDSNYEIDPETGNYVIYFSRRKKQHFVYLPLLY